MWYKKYYNIVSLKRDWLELEKKGSCSSPFQTYGFMQRAWLYFYPYYLKNKYIPEFYSFYVEGKCVMIVPLVRYINQQRAQIFGYVNGFNYTDIVVSEPQYIDEAFRLLKSEIDVLECYRVLESSSLWNRYKGTISKDVAIKNVSIGFGDDYGLYVKSLSKSTRQNLRTAYNRMNTDGKALDFRVLSGNGGVNCVTISCL